jgi:uncharacterized Zn-finger protein
VDARYRGVIRLPNSSRGQCLQCGREFSVFANARRHYELVHTDAQRTHTCHICKSLHKSIHSLQTHLRQQHNIYQKNLPKVLK